MDVYLQASFHTTGKRGVQLLQFPRSLARQFRSLLRKSVLAQTPGSTNPLILCKAGRQGLTLSCKQGDVGLRYHASGSCNPTAIALPASLLTDIEGRSNVPVTLELVAPAKGRASWHDSGVPNLIEFATTEPGSLPTPTEPSRSAMAMAPGFLAALEAGAQTASRDSNRLALHQIMLRARDGAMIATDGRQLLVQTGFPFRWSEDLLIPALPVFGSRELPQHEPVKFSRTGEYVTLEIGPWLFSLKAEVAKKYPDVNKVIPDTRGKSSRLHIEAEDAGVLMQALPRLPGRAEPCSPVTLDLKLPVAIRAREEKGPAAEVKLQRSRVEGPALQLVMDRRYLLRAVKLGFTELIAVSADRPMLCKDEKRLYLWMPLEPDHAVPREKGTSVNATQGITLAPAPNVNIPTRKPVMAVTNGKPADDPVNRTLPNGEPVDPLIEGEALGSLLHEATVRTTRMIVALKHQRRQSRAVQAAMASLRKLQHTDL